MNLSTFRKVIQHKNLDRKAITYILCRAMIRVNGILEVLGNFERKYGESSPAQWNVYYVCTLVFSTA